MKAIDQGERIVSFSDLKRLLLEIFPLLKKGGTVAFCGAFFLSLFLPISFQSKASFKTAPQISDKVSSYKDLLTTGSLSQKESAPLVILQSDVILEKVVQKLGLQVEITNLKRFCSRPVRNLLWAFGRAPQEEAVLQFEEV